MVVVDYVEDEEHPLGDFYVAPAVGGVQATVIPRGFYVLYYDPETPGWMIDSQPGLHWNSATRQWEVN